jgi:hypothetical protein
MFAVKNSTKRRLADSERTKTSGSFSDDPPRDARSRRGIGTSSELMDVMHYVASGSRTPQDRQSTARQYLARMNAAAKEIVPERFTSRGA